ncbi:hypothetical protein [Pedobacter sp. WC2423]|uniref:hypothetical protein n=1 Tax=Pedobacter sp. WC2423 TaxID=3234142 RepID=UPI003465C9F7
MNLLHYQRLNDLICSQNTGPVKELAIKLEVSERKIKYMIKRMKDDYESPIYFNHALNSYVYKEGGCCYFKFQKTTEDKILEILKLINKLFPGHSFFHNGPK